MKLSKYEKFFLFEIAAILIVNVNFFGLPIVSDAFIWLADYHRKKLVCGLVTFLFVQYFVFERKLKLVINAGSYFKLVYFYLFMIFVISGMSCVIYSQKLDDLFNTYYYLISILLFFVLDYHFKKSDNFYQHFLNLIIDIGVLYAVYVIIAKVLYRFGFTIFSTQIYYVQTRGNSLRLASPADYLGIAAVLCFAILIRSHFAFSTQKQRLSYMKFIVIVFAVIFVTQTRIYEVAIISSCLLMYLFSAKLTIKKVVIVLLLSIFVLFFWDILEHFFASFSVTSENNEYLWSTLLRLEGIDYYLSHMFDHKIMGLGFIVNRSYSWMLYGDNGNIVVSDVGYFGFLGVYGILGLLFLVFWYYNNIKTSIIIARKHLSFQYIEHIGLFIFIAVSFLSVIFSDSQRTLYLPIYLAIFDYIYNKSNRVVLKKNIGGCYYEKGGNY